MNSFWVPDLRLIQSRGLVGLCGNQPLFSTSLACRWKCMDWTVIYICVSMTEFALFDHTIHTGGTLPIFPLLSFLIFYVSMQKIKIVHYALLWVMCKTAVESNIFFLFFLFWKYYLVALCIEPFLRRLLNGSEGEKHQFIISVWLGWWHNGRRHTSIQLCKQVIAHFPQK